jgi:hypothetical protein
MSLQTNIIGREFKNSMGGLSINGRTLCNAGGVFDPSTAGYDYTISTLDTIYKRIIEQKFYKVPFADYMPVDVGINPFGEDVIQNLTFNIAGSFFDGDIQNHDGAGRTAEVNAGLTNIRMPSIIWSKKVPWTLFELKKAARANWDVVEQKLKTIKTNWDLGLQEVAFLGHPSIPLMTGLLNNAEVNINTTLITKPLSDMTETEFTAFIKGLIDAFYQNSNKTEYPDTFVIPTSDYNGLVIPYSSTYPNFPHRLAWLEKVLSDSARKPVKILPLAYSEAALNVSRGIDKNRYVLYNKNPETMTFNIPIDYIGLPSYSANGIHWEQYAYGQYSGVLVPRPLEILYLDETTP